MVPRPRYPTMTDSVLCVRLVTPKRRVTNQHDEEGRQGDCKVGTLDVRRAQRSPPGGMHGLIFHSASCLTTSRLAMDSQAVGPRSGPGDKLKLLKSRLKRKGSVRRAIPTAATASAAVRSDHGVTTDPGVHRASHTHTDAPAANRAEGAGAVIHAGAGAGGGAGSGSLGRRRDAGAGTYGMCDLDVHCGYMCGMRVFLRSSVAAWYGVVAWGTQVPHAQQVTMWSSSKW